MTVEIQVPGGAGPANVPHPTMGHVRGYSFSIEKLLNA